MSIWRADRIILDKYEVGVVGMLVTVLLPTFAVLVLQVFRDVLSGNMNNLGIYFVTAIVFLVMLIASGWLFRRYGREISVSGRMYRILTSGGFMCNLLLLAICYHTSPTVYPGMSGEWFPWHRKTEWKVLLFMTGVAVLGIIIYLVSDRLKTLMAYMRYPVYLAASAVGGFSMYCGNYLASDKMHGTAYYTSVYNALMNAPYDYCNQSIYGHYAILLKYPVKWLGGSYTDFTIVMAVIGGLSILFFALALDMCVKNHYISMIGVWSIPVMYLYYTRNHWQMFPHRVLFAGIELFLLTLYFKKRTKGMQAIGYLVNALAMLWNMETGIVCLGVWCLAGILHEVLDSDMTYVGSENAIVSKSRLLCVLKCTFRNAAYSVMSVLGMVVVFNLYNMPLGEKWHGLRFLLYPYISGWDTPEVLVAQASEQTVGNTVSIAAALGEIDFGFTSSFSISFPIQISSWYFVFLLLAACIVLAVARIIYGKAGDVDYIMVLSAVLALGHLVYFINRPCFDYLAIAFFEAVLIMGVLADEAVDGGMTAQNSGLGVIKRAYQYLFIAILSVLSVFSVWQAIYRILDRVSIGYYVQEEFEELLYEIQETVPKDTMALGTCSHEIYAQLGWDTGNYAMDFPDMDGNVHAIANIFMKVSLQKEYLVSVRHTRDGQKIPIHEYMSYWGVQPEALTILKQWDLGLDSGNYWDIYYLEIDQSVEHTSLDYYGEIYQRDQSYKRK